MRRKGKKLAQVARLQARGLLYFPNSDDAYEDDAELDAALAGFGLYDAGADAVVDDAESDDDAPAAPPDQCFLWPCNQPTFAVWQQLHTQWSRDAAGGRCGLRYEAVISYMREVARVKPKHFDQVFAGLQAMETAAMEVWVQQRSER